MSPWRCVNTEDSRHDVCVVRVKAQLRKRGNRCVFSEAQKSESGSEGHSTGCLW